jgi:chorismate lyase
MPQPFSARATLYPLTHPLPRHEADWRPWPRFRWSGRPPLRLRPWLRDTGSLTAHLRACCGPGFRVEVLGQGWGTPLPSERRRLGLRRGELALVREVRLACADRGAWVFARTLIPAASLRGPAKRLSRLGSRPLGEVLFAQRGARRGETEMARLGPGHALYPLALAGQAAPPGWIWGRRTLFHLGGCPLLVNEIFLPGLPDFPR